MCLEDIMLSEGTRHRKQALGAHSHVGAGKVGFAEIQARVGVPRGWGWLGELEVWESSKDMC